MKKDKRKPKTKMKKETKKAASTASSKGAKALQAVAKGKPAITEIPAATEPPKPVPPDTVIEESVKIKMPDPSLGPNEKFPFAILVTDKAEIYYERYKSEAERKRRVKALEKRVTKIEPVDYAKPEAPLGAPKGITLIQGGKEGAPSPTPINKRLTPGARVDEWRIARSLRANKPGFFLQGGFIEVHQGRKMFRVAEEEHFLSLPKAKEALVAKLPVAVPVGEATKAN